MKNRYIISIILFAFLLFTSCSVEDLIKEEPDNTEILVSNSPWKFESFKLAWATKTEKDTITDQEIEREVNDSYKDLEFTFNADGTGQTTAPNAEVEFLVWDWFFDGSNKICFGATCGADSFTSIQLSENSFSFDLTAGAPSNTEGEKIIYSGRYTLK